MATSTPIHQGKGCDIAQTEGHIRVDVGPGLATEVQACYRAFVAECLNRQCARALIVGIADLDPFYHLAARDALRAMALAGVPANFRLAFVAKTGGLIAVYDTAVVEASRLGIEARRFITEDDAERWLNSGPGS
jgi:hypothetical protein